MVGFHAHLKDAIALNRERRKYYAEISDGRTRSLSTRLIYIERFLFPFARYFDSRASKFNARGIEIVKKDFVPMEVFEKERAPLYKKELTAVLKQVVRRELKEFLSEINVQKDLVKISKNTFIFFERIRIIERDSEVHLSMLKHLLESIYLISSNGMEYCDQSKGETLNLTLDLIRMHKVGLRHSMFIDQWANYFHQEGVGIIVNDLPEIIK